MLGAETMKRNIPWESSEMYFAHALRCLGIYHRRVLYVDVRRDTASAG